VAWHYFVLLLVICCGIAPVGSPSSCLCCGTTLCDTLGGVSLLLLLQNPGAALVIGLFAGALSVVGFTYITPWMSEKLGIRDTCGVHNLHAIPGMLGIFVAGWAAFGMDSNEYLPLVRVGLSMGMGQVDVGLGPWPACRSQHAVYFF
jgi:hypothetical protein